MITWFLWVLFPCAAWMLGLILRGSLDAWIQGLLILLFAFYGTLYYSER